MTDRELLELAAKAAGVILKPIQINNVTKQGDDRFIGYIAECDQWARVWFNPLTNDGDALRLAVRLKIDVAHTNIHAPQVHALADAKVQVWEEIKDDPNAATRRAIVRAAAEIERNMK